MSMFILINVGLLFFVVLMLIFLTFVWPPDSPWSPWWKTNKKISQAIIKLAKIQKNDVVFELGSGDGEFALFVARTLGSKVTGIEIEHTRFWVSQVRKLLSHVENVTFIRKDFKNVSYKTATAVYFYLVPNAIVRILPKLTKELKSGAKIISYKYALPEDKKIKLVDANTREKIYYYKVV